MIKVTLHIHKGAQRQQHKGDQITHGWATPKPIRGSQQPIQAPPAQHREAQHCTVEGGNPNSQLLRNKLRVQATPWRATGCETHPNESRKQLLRSPLTLWGAGEFLAGDGTQRDAGEG